MGELAAAVLLARNEGWGVAFYEHHRADVLRQGIVPEDERIADWTFLLSVTPTSRSLVLGCGWGAVPAALAQARARVVTVDPDEDALSLLALRANEQELSTIHRVRATGFDLPFVAESFDLISVGATYWRSIDFETAAKRVVGLLAPGGIAQFSVGNRTSFQRIAPNPSEKAAAPSHTLATYRAILRRSGFEEVRVFAPLPRFDQVPLYVAPIDGSGAMKFVLRNSLALFEKVSPEVKREHDATFRVAKAAVKVALSLKLARLAGVFAPGFTIIAKKRIQG